MVSGKRLSDRLRGDRAAIEEDEGMASDEGQNDRLSSDLASFEEDEVDFDALDQEMFVNSMFNNSNISSDSDSSDSDFHESDYNMEDNDDKVFEVNVDLGIERDIGGVAYMGGSSLGFAAEPEGEQAILDSDYEKSDFLHSVYDSDDAGNTSSRRFTEFNNAIDMENPKLEKGMLFSTRESLKEAVKQYGRKNRYNLKFVRNDKRRVKAICKKDCPWVLWGSKFNPKDKMDNTWQIKTYVSNHTCLKEMSNRNITSRWMSSHYLQKFSNDQHYSISSLQQDVRTEFNVLVPLSKCYRAKVLALEKVFGNASEQYARIYDYVEELRQTNEGTTTICLLECRLFLRMYVCLQACKAGFKAGCKPIISLDACFLKGYYGGHLMVAVGIDANDCMYPIAFAAVESENNRWERSKVTFNIKEQS